MRPGTKSVSLFERRLPFLPTFLPDETLYSWCCRYHRLSGNSHAAATSMQLFGSKTAGLMHDFPARLATFMERTNGEVGDIYTIANLHTLLGFYATFLTSETAENLVRNMAEGSVDRLKFRLGLPASRVGAAHPLRACPVCMHEDEANGQIPYWRLAHQLPGVLVCEIHAKALSVSSIKTKTASRLQWVLPLDVGADQWRPAVPSSPAAILILERVARLILGFRNIRETHLNETTLHHTYLAGIKRHGWLTRSGSVRMAAVREAFMAYAYSLEGVSDYQFIASAFREDGGFLGLLLRRPRFRAHPTKHAVAISFLFDNLADFLQTYQSMTLNPDILAQEKTKANQDARTHLKAAFLELLSSGCLSISGAARCCGITVGTATSWASQNSIQFRRRPKVMHPSAETRISELLGQGIDRNDVAKETGVSRQSVDRLLQSRPDLKEEWSNKSRLRKRAEYRARFLETVSNHPRLSIKAIRSIPGNGFQWLYRHDTEWLSAHLPSLWRSS